jgi:hypothetical protein
MVFGAVCGTGARKERGTRRGGGVAALREDKEGRLGFIGLPRLGIKREGKGARSRRGASVT